MINSQFLKLHFSQLVKAWKISKYNSYSDAQKQNYHNNLSELFSCLKKVNFDLQSPTEQQELKEVIDFFILSLQFLNNSTVNCVPYEIVECLKVAMNEWIVETKVKLCGLYVREPFDYIFDEEDYNLFLRTFDLPESLMEYRKYLYIYGAFIRHQSHKCKTSEMQEEFRQQDRDALCWRRMLEQLEKFFLTSKPYVYKIQSSKQSKNEKLFLGNEERFQDTVIKFLIEEICAFENARQDGQKTRPEDVNLERIQLQLAAAREIDYELNGTKRGFSTPLELLASQTTIRVLSYLVRLDCLFTDVSYSRIIDVPLTKEDYLFIYRYIDYFDLLAYKKTANTTTPEKLIRQRLKSFPQGKKILDGLLGLEQKINEIAIYLKEANARLKY